jgi:predicted ribosomally synthesized peptide with SipW-like signal peptide
MRNKVLTLTLSILAIVICLSLITMGTYALFSETITVENHLQADGSVYIPEVLRKYMGGKEFITPKK